MWIPFVWIVLPFDFLLSVPSLGTFKSLQLERHHVAKKSCFSLLQLLWHSEDQICWEKFDCMRFLASSIVGSWPRELSELTFPKAPSWISILSTEAKAANLRPQGAGRRPFAADEGQQSAKQSRIASGMPLEKLRWQFRRRFRRQFLANGW